MAEHDRRPSIIKRSGDPGSYGEVCQARLEETIYCPCCKSTIRLVDETASVEGGKRDIDNAMKELEQSLSKLNRTFKIRF